MEFVEGMQGAPEVGDFVFEEAAGEGEDAVDGLGELEKDWVIPRFSVEGESFEQSVEERGSFDHTDCDAISGVVQCT